MPGFEVIGKEERHAVNEIFVEGGVLFAHGFDRLRKRFHVRELESDCGAFFGSKDCLAVSSGTAALKVALKALGVQPGDEVITQAFNFIATVEAILDCGAIPKIANIDSSMNIDLRELEGLISKRTAAILPVHMLGISAPMGEILSLAKKRNLPVLEDNCEAIGAKYGRKYLGTLGKMGAMSFDHGKMIACGEGGLVLSQGTQVAQIAREYHDHGHENNPALPRGRDTRSRWGFNYRMTEMQAAVAKVQLRKLPWMLKENKKRYDALHGRIKNTFSIRPLPKGSTSTWDTLMLTDLTSSQKEKIITVLKDEGIGTKNIPDAMEWHCAAFWDHALDRGTVRHCQKTLKILERCVAIPIWLRRSVEDYRKLGKTLAILT